MEREPHCTALRCTYLHRAMPCRAAHSNLQYCTGGKDKVEGLRRRSRERKGVALAGKGKISLLTAGLAGALRGQAGPGLGEGGGLNHVAAELSLLLLMAAVAAVRQLGSNSLVLGSTRRLHLRRNIYSDVSPNGEK